MPFPQVWFRDAKFREGVYSCLPPSTGNVEVSAPDSRSSRPRTDCLLSQASPVFQLQVLFAFLQQSQQAVYDPDPLVDALKIKKTEQQDAQEFSKLFLSLLDHEFKKQGKRAEAEGLDGRMGRIVQDQVRPSPPTLVPMPQRLTSPLDASSRERWSTAPNA